jgi:hypothetical protein
VTNSLSDSECDTRLRGWIARLLPVSQHDSFSFSDISMLHTTSRFKLSSCYTHLHVSDYLEIMLWFHGPSFKKLLKLLWQEHITVFVSSDHIPYRDSYTRSRLHSCRSRQPWCLFFFFKTGWLFGKESHVLWDERNLMKTLQCYYKSVLVIQKCQRVWLEVQSLQHRFTPAHEFVFLFHRFYETVW